MLSAPGLCQILKTLTFYVVSSFDFRTVISPKLSRRADVMLSSKRLLEKRSNFKAFEWFEQGKIGGTRRISLR